MSSFQNSSFSKQKALSQKFITSNDTRKRVEIAAEFFVLKEKIEYNLKKIKELKSDT